MKKIKSIMILSILLITLILNLSPALAQNYKMEYRNQSMKNKDNNDTLCVVKKGDCLWKIAKRHNFKLNHIINANQHFKDPDLIYPGDKVYVPHKKDMQKNNMQQPKQTDKMKQQPNNMEKQDTTPPTDNQMTTMKQQVVNLVNQERKQRGLKLYQDNTKVAKVAQIKAEDMRDNNYFSHQSPTYGSPFEMLKQFNVKYTAAGENIAKGQRTAEEVMNSWMNSPGHRKNILSKKYTQIGIGLAKNDRGANYWVQMFIRE